jgi:hypothetical protein
MSAADPSLVSAVIFLAIAVGLPLSSSSSNWRGERTTSCPVATSRAMMTRIDQTYRIVDRDLFNLEPIVCAAVSQS